MCLPTDGSGFGSRVRIQVISIAKKSLIPPHQLSLTALKKNKLLYFTSVHSSSIGATPHDGITWLSDNKNFNK